MNTTLTPKQLEQAWVKFQLDISGIRSALIPMYQITGNARRAHTFYPEQAPEPQAVMGEMGPTPNECNGVPDAYFATTGGAYGARALSVMTASVILVWLDTAIQEFARTLGQPPGDKMLAGDDIATAPGQAPIKASTLIWAGANSVRHVDEWASSASSYRAPQTNEERRLRDRQNRSMEPLAAVLRCQLPITENAAYEIFQELTAVSETQGTGPRLELHVLRIGQDLIQRAGLANAPIGVTIKGHRPIAQLKNEPPENIVISDGIARAASSLPDSGKFGAVRPLSN